MFGLGTTIIRLFGGSGAAVDRVRAKQKEREAQEEEAKAAEKAAKKAEKKAKKAAKKAEKKAKKAAKKGKKSKKSKAGELPTADDIFSDSGV